MSPGARTRGAARRDRGDHGDGPSWVVLRSGLLLQVGAVLVLVDALRTRVVRRLAGDVVEVGVVGPRVVLLVREAVDLERATLGLVVLQGDAQGRDGLLVRLAV